MICDCHSSKGFSSLALSKTRTKPCSKLQPLFLRWKRSGHVTPQLKKTQISGVLRWFCEISEKEASNCLTRWLLVIVVSCQQVVQSGVWFLRLHQLALWDLSIKTESKFSVWWQKCGHEKPAALTQTESLWNRTEHTERDWRVADSRLCVAKCLALTLTLMKWQTKLVTCDFLRFVSQTVLFFWTSHKWRNEETDTVPPQALKLNTVWKVFVFKNDDIFFC